MVIRPWEVVYPIVDLRVRVSRALGAELEDCPVLGMFLIKECNELV